ncbi:MAG: YitT family protein [Salinivirgaceae bacterium]|jgi:uncharacterized membrane-anchored protein YitT (DUF2179 family)|nr:YitT family protein [Bacteroidales bacterium]
MSKLLKKEGLARQIRSWIIMTFGLFVNALGWTAFLIPGKMVGGGVTGVATIIYYATNGWIPVSVTFFIINIFLVAIAIKILGASFGVKTIYNVIVLSVFLAVLQLVLPKEGLMDVDPFLFAVIGGALGGIGVGIVFTQGGSTGGTDIIAMIINKYRNISPGRAILYMDILIISSSVLVFKNIGSLVYGFVTMAVLAYSVDLIIEGKKQTAQIFIFSPKYEEIGSELGANIGRGITFIDGQGYFTRTDTKILLIIIRKHEMSRVFQIVKKIDPDAFMSVASVMGTYGKGFEKIRA